MALQRRNAVARTLLTLMFSMTLLAPQQPAAKLRFEISFAASAHAQPITGRVFVMIARTNDREPRLQIGRTGAPFFGHDVENLAPGQVGIINETDQGTPIDSVRDLPAGEYYVQGLIS